MSEYAERDPMELEPHYSRHVSAMTGEQLHSKADIAAELAWRDQQIDKLHEERDALAATIAQLTATSSTSVPLLPNAANSILAARDARIRSEALLEAAEALREEANKWKYSVANHGLIAATLREMADAIEKGFVQFSQTEIADAKREARDMSQFLLATESDPFKKGE